jgi:uncharacterized RDD family membrane protein YckC
MVNCEKCGAELKEGAAFCQKCGAPVTVASPVVVETLPASPTPSSTTPQRIIDLAGWGSRIIAYIIDAVIFSIIFGIIEGIFYLPTIIFYGGAPYMNYTPFTSSGLRDVAFFIYFIVMDHCYGASIGKMIMRIRVTNLECGPITLGQAIIESIGKAFGPLIILDVILGWIFTTQKSQRVFTYLAQTIVVKGKTPR